MAKKISVEEAHKLGLRPFGKKHHVRVLIEQLEIGELLAITRLDFTWKRQTPGRFVHEHERATAKKFTIQKTENGTAWVVTRVE